MIDIKNLSYSLPNGIKLINNLSFCLNDQKKVALIGPNGIGKSTLIKIIMNEIEPNNGKITKNNLNIAYMPQQFNKLNFNTIADVFNLEKQVISITKVDKNNADTVDYINLEGFWDCVEVISKKLDFFNLKFNPLQKFSNLSGGEKVKVISGPFEGMFGTIKSVDLKEAKLEVSIDLFGQETTVELELSQISKA